MGWMHPSLSTDDVIAALGQSNRVCEVHMNLAGWQLENVLAAMQVPFPELTDLRLISYEDTPPVIPDSFLGRSAPRLRFLHLHSIPFPGLPKLLLSAIHLVELDLHHIPHSGYISPEAMVALISVSSSLEKLSLYFQPPQSRPDWESRSLLPLKRTILPALHYFSFQGFTEYLEQVVTHIDTPQLGRMRIIFFDQIDFDCPRLTQFINCTPALKALNEAHVRLCTATASVTLQSLFVSDNLLIDIWCSELNRQLSAIKQVFNSSLQPVSTIEYLYIRHRSSQRVWTIENTLWLELLLPFTAVKNLFLSKEFVPGIAVALQELDGGRVIEVLPRLEEIFIEGLEPSGPFQERIGRFVVARQLFDHPIAISSWDNDTEV